MPYATRQPNVPAGVRSRVYRRLVAQLVDDPVLSAVVKTWDSGLDRTPIRTDAATEVHVVLQPRIGNQDRRTVESWVGWLEVAIQIAPAGGDAGLSDAAYVLDLAELVENAIYPRPETDSDADARTAQAKRLAFQAELRALGCVTGEVDMASPPTVHASKDGLVCVGMMRVEVRRLLNA